MRPPCPTCGACSLRPWLRCSRYDVDVDKITSLEVTSPGSLLVCRLCGLEEESRGRVSWIDSGNLTRSALGLVASETVLATFLRAAHCWVADPPQTPAAVAYALRATIPCWGRRPR